MPALPAFRPEAGRLRPASAGAGEPRAHGQPVHDRCRI